MILPLMLGKLGAGLIAIALAYWIAVPTALELERQDREAGIIGEDEYPSVGALGAGEGESVEQTATGRSEERE
jgi:hypothetical protein